MKIKIIITLAIFIVLSCLLPVRILDSSNTSTSSPTYSCGGPGPNGARHCTAMILDSPNGYTDKIEAVAIYDYRTDSADITINAGDVIRNEVIAGLVALAPFAVISNLKGNNQKTKRHSI